MHTYRKFIIATAICASQFFSFPASAMTAGDLAEFCNVVKEGGIAELSEPEAAKATICASYLLGVRDSLTLHTVEIMKLGQSVHSLIDDEDSLLLISICIPREEGVSAIVSVVKKYLNDHPEHHDVNASLVAAAALKEHFC